MRVDLENRVGFFSQLEQYASSHHWRSANQPQFEGREHKHCTVRSYHTSAGEASKATITGEAGHGMAKPAPEGLAGDRSTLLPSTPTAGGLATPGPKGA